MAELGVYSSLHFVLIFLIYDLIPATARCINDPFSTNSTSGGCTPALPDQTPYPDENQRPQESTYSVFYAAAIFFGVVGVPLLILFRICWLRRLNNTHHRHYPGQSQNEDGHGYPFTISVDPDGYLPSYEQSIADAPPPYDVLELPPPYKLKKDKSSASLPSYTSTSGDVNSPTRSTINSSSETNRAYLSDEQTHTSSSETNETENNR